MGRKAAAIARAVVSLDSRQKGDPDFSGSFKPLAPFTRVEKLQLRASYLSLLRAGPVSRFGAKILGSAVNVGAADATYKALLTNRLDRPVSIVVFADFATVGGEVSISRDTTLEQEVARLSTDSPFEVVSDPILLGRDRTLYIADSNVSGAALGASDLFTARICDPIGDGLIGSEAWPEDEE